ncbi:hypothetical protein ppKF707_1812 [Metapseudomonas furukawaii]|nr:hypothetical protein ppKF707_1812 [Pseudomonas furukawaii]
MVGHNVSIDEKTLEASGRRLECRSGSGFQRSAACSAFRGGRTA